MTWARDAKERADITRRSVPNWKVRTDKRSRGRSRKRRTGDVGEVKITRVERNNSGSSKMERDCDTRRKKEKTTCIRKHCK